MDAVLNLINRGEIKNDVAFGIMVVEELVFHNEP